MATHIEGEVGEIEAIERWVDRVADESLPHGDRDFVRRWLEKRGSAEETSEPSW